MATTKPALCGPRDWIRALDADDDLGAALLPVAITNTGEPAPLQAPRRANDVRVTRWAARARGPLSVEARA